MSKQLLLSKENMPKPSIHVMLEKSKPSPFNRSEKFSNCGYNDNTYLL